MSTDAESLLVEILTPARLQSYLVATDQNISSAIDLYKWNGLLAAELFQILGLVEISVRNSIDRELQSLNVTLGNQGEWFDDLGSVLGTESLQQIHLVKARLVANRRRLSRGNIVSELNFGFWRSFLSRQYKDSLWRTAIRFSFPYSPSRQPEYIFTRVRHLHVLRNRIAHHEPIHNRDIARDYQICFEVLSAISPVIAEWSEKNSHVMQVLAHKPFSL